jgi:hypothetical protein
MDDIFRFPSAVRRDPAIDAWLQVQNDDLRPLLVKWFGRMRQCGDDVRELMHDGRPTACVEDAAFGYVGAFKVHVDIGFFFGAMLKDPAGLLEGTGRRGRHVKLMPGREVDSALGELIDAAYADMRTRIGYPDR